MPFWIKELRCPSNLVESLEKHVEWLCVENFFAVLRYSYF